MDQALLTSVSVDFLRSVPSLTAATDSVAALKFRICNNGYQPVSGVDFEARTFTGAGAAARIGPFSSDSVIGQAGCVEQTFDGPWALGDSIVIDVRGVAGGGR